MLGITMATRTDQTLQACRSRKAACRLGRARVVPATGFILLEVRPSTRGEGVVRSVDDIQYENRLRGFDFDIMIATWPGPVRRRD